MVHWGAGSADMHMRNRQSAACFVRDSTTYGMLGALDTVALAGMDAGKMVPRRSWHFTLTQVRGCCNFDSTPFVSADRPTFIMHRHCAIDQNVQ
jgi:hypothetical protein